MSTESGKPNYIFYSESRQNMVLVFMGTTPEEYADFMDMVDDYKNFNKYRSNLKLFTEIEAFENSKIKYD